VIKNFVPARPLRGQEEYYELLQEKEIIFATGNAGSGKSFLALNEALRQLTDSRSKIQKIVVIRPYIFTGVENLGALPGTLGEKILPFVAAVRDNLSCLLSRNQDIEYVINNIEFLTLSTLRGRSLHNSFIIIEEGQNVPSQDDAMLTILTRMGKNSRLVVAGDLSQCDISYEHVALLEAANALKDLPEVGYTEMDDIRNTHRNPLVGRVIQAFNEYRQNLV
jgi:phosphate starvation-inducible PhoH-like protein